MTKEQNSGRDPNSGHGHVYKRPDGVKARCGGPPICAECARDMAALQASYKPQAPVTSNERVIPDAGIALTPAEVRALGTVLLYLREDFHDKHPAACAGMLLQAYKRVFVDAETAAPQAPIAWVVVADNGGICASGSYAPGLPPGQHDLYCEPEKVAPYLRSTNDIGAGIPPDGAPSMPEHSPDETSPVIVAWAVGNVLEAPAIYNIDEFGRASDAARRWGKPITGLVQAPNTPTFAPRPYSPLEPSPPPPKTDEIRDLACCDTFVRESASEFCATCGYTNLDHLRKRAAVKATATQWFKGDDTKPCENCGQYFSAHDVSLRCRENGGDKHG